MTIRSVCYTFIVFLCLGIFIWSQVSCHSWCAVHVYRGSGFKQSKITYKYPVWCLIRNKLLKMVETRLKVRLTLKQLKLPNRFFLLLLLLKILN